MNSKILKCKNCGAILVIQTKDLWKIGKCTVCESNKLEDFDKELCSKKCKMNALRQKGDLYYVKSSKKNRERNEKN